MQGERISSLANDLTGGLVPRREVVLAIVVHAQYPALVECQRPLCILLNAVRVGFDVGAEVRVSQYVLMSASPVCRRATVGDGWRWRLGVVLTPPRLAGG